MIEFMRSAATVHSNVNGTEPLKRPTQALGRDDRDDEKSIAVTQSVQQSREALVVATDLNKDESVQRIEQNAGLQLNQHLLSGKKTEAVADEVDSGVAKNSTSEASSPPKVATQNILHDLHTLEPGAVLGTRVSTSA